MKGTCDGCSTEDENIIYKKKVANNWTIMRYLCIVDEPLLFLSMLLAEKDFHSNDEQRWRKKAILI